MNQTNTPPARAPGLPRRLLDLFLAFARIGLFTFGGGYAMLPLIEETCVTKRNWITHEQLLDMTVIAESTPGPIAVNCATFVGFRQGGAAGAAAATFGVALPSFLLIFFLSAFLGGWLEIPLVARAFRGVRIAVALLVLDAGFNLLKTLRRRPLEIVILSVSALLTAAAGLFGAHISSVLLMLLSALAGVTALGITRWRGRGKEERP